MNKYFQRNEFACQCGCGFAAVDAELLDVITDVREAYGPLVITSGCRCEEHNTAVGGAKNSAHKLGLAADFRPPLSAVKEYPQLLGMIQEYLLEKYPEKYGIARGSSFIHIDVKPGGARRWIY